MIKGFIFDFDGLILDTETPHLQAWQEVFAEYGEHIQLADWLKLIGTGPIDYDPGIDLFNRRQGNLDLQAVRNQANTLTTQKMANMQVLPGVINFLQAASKLNAPLAVASSSPRDWVEPLMQEFALTQYFDIVVTADNVSHVKPEPDLYLLAAGHLGLKPTEVIAFEDSVNGIRAAQAAGIYCVAVPNSVTGHMNVEIADKIVKSFFELSPQQFLTRQDLN
jgi:HAD superfamily hydrolase (TIGR01509 family)